MEHEINLAISTIFNGRKYSLGLAHEQSGGGMLLGVGLSEKTYKASIATSLSANTQINVGLTKVESSIPYFDQTYPSLTLTHNW